MNPARRRFAIPSPEQSQTRSVLTAQVLSWVAVCLAAPFFFPVYPGLFTVIHLILPWTTIALAVAFTKNFTLMLTTGTGSLGDGRRISLTLLSWPVLLANLLYPSYVHFLTPTAEFYWPAALIGAVLFSAVLIVSWITRHDLGWPKLVLSWMPLLAYSAAYGYTSAKEIDTAFDRSQGWKCASTVLRRVRGGGVGPGGGFSHLLHALKQEK